MIIRLVISSSSSLEGYILGKYMHLLNQLEILLKELLQNQ